MEDTQNNKQQSQALFADAKEKMAEDMKAREIGAIIWDNASAGFHYIPEIVRKEGDDDSKITTARIMGLYLYEDKIYLIEEGKSEVSISDFYNEGVDVPPTVITLSEDAAVKEFGDPDGQKGFTTDGTLEEWTVIADCYFEALNEM